MRFYISLFLFFAYCITAIAQTDEFFESKVTVGGYGELHYNYSKVENTKASEILDFHRFVIFLGYNFNEKWSFKSEVDLEHNFVQNGQGELELEQAYVEYNHADWFGFQAGVILPSIGLLNEYHEPPLFFGVERPDYHSKIIPTTWFGNGVSFFGNYKSFDYKLTIMEGLNSDSFSESAAIRNGRLKGYKANAENLLYNLRVNYLGFPGLKFGASYSYNNASGDTSQNAISIYEVHASYQRNNLYLVFEYGNIDYEKYNLKKSNGFYIDLGYDVSSLLNWRTRIIPFIRYTDYNTAASTLTGGNSEKANHNSYWMVGCSVKPIEKVVFKIDYGIRTKELGSQETTLFNLGVGYMF
ncbi:hypothetical protein [Melioribacter sp. OK-6-Me]|uniref:hypothetical protein n=1 Tax=unclassified Melioribacter TaxID=2627329 RepID=UPI003ED8EBBC